MVLDIVEKFTGGSGVGGMSGVECKPGGVGRYSAPTGVDDGVKNAVLGGACGIGLFGVCGAPLVGV